MTEDFDSSSSIVARITETSLSDKQLKALSALLSSFEEQNELRVKLDRIKTQALRLKGATEEFLKQNPLER